MTPNLVLSIFPGIDLLGRPFEGMGSCVVRGPDLAWGGELRPTRLRPKVAGRFGHFGVSPGWSGRAGAVLR